MVLFPAAQVHYFTDEQPSPTLKDGTKNPPATYMWRCQALELRHRQAGADPGDYPCAIGTPEQSFMPMSTPLSFGSGPLCIRE